jgi:outer membrane lipoprotein-sorting protein
MRITVIAVLFVVLAAPSYPNQDGSDLLRSSYTADRKATYAATMRTRVPTPSGPAESSLKIWRKAGRQRIEYLSPPLQGRILLDDGRGVYWLEPGKRSASIAPTGREIERLGLLMRNYQVSTAGTGTVAGRNATILKVTPRRPPGPWRKLWIDRATSVILRTDSYNSDDQFLSSTYVTSVDFNAEVPQSLLQVPVGWSLERVGRDEMRRWSADALSARIGITLREPSYLPPGFVLDGWYLASTGRGMPNAHARYTDGLNSLSVFQHSYGPGKGRGKGMGRGWRGGRGPVEEGTADPCQMLAVGTGRCLRAPRQDRMYMVVADLPEAELRKVADSLP